MKSVSLALGSGGARGFAHVGVIKCLVENDVKISAIAGSSAGALIGAFYSLYGDISKAEQITLEYVSENPFKLFELSNLTDRYSKEVRIKLFLEEIFREKTFSDLKIPLSVATCDLETGKEYDINTGRVIDAVFASMSVPGVFGPTFFWGKWLSDGGLVNSTPVSLAKKMSSDYTVAVDLTSLSPISYDKKPGQFQIMGRSLDVMMHSVSRFRLESVQDTMILYPEFSKGSYTFSEESAKASMKLGYDLMKSRIEDLKLKLI